MALGYSSAFYEALGLNELHTLLETEEHSSHRIGVEQGNDRWLRHLSPTTVVAEGSGLNSSSSSPVTDHPETSDTFAADLRSPEMMLRDKLVDLYFQHVHPLCPVVDEYSFRQLYRPSRHDELFTHFSNALLQAMMFAAIQYMDDSQLSNLSTFTSIPHAQSTYYNIAKKAYRLEIFQRRDSSSEADRARICLLLSYWCPQDSAAEINSHWIDRAIYHFRAALLNPPAETWAWKHDIKIIYWSCNVRNTLVSLALRRPARLHQIQTELFAPDEVLDKFLYKGQGSDSIARLYQIQIFIWTCKICKILNHALSSLGQTMLLDNQDLGICGLVDNTDADERFRFSALSTGSLQLLHIQEIEAQLLGLRVTYVDVLEKLKGSGGWVDTIERSNLGPYYMNEIITFSSIISLYGSYLNKMPCIEPQRLQDLSLRKMNEHSEKVGLLGQEVLKNVETAHIPIAMLAWSILPATLGFIRQGSHGSLKYTSNLLELAKLLVPRFQGAKSMFSLLRDVDFMIQSAISRKKSDAVTQNCEVPKRSLEKRLGDRRTSADVDALRQIMELLDLDLAHGNPSTGDEEFR
ncbi:hypothetical protein B0J11DRAFT_541912 [Dendryphion nanum]|uniref:Xylanolytic transcriptional activator regulatory domain-containing protein n=1 Tax=Dendryphion nanum TaxID=256645 RepID=A0A9P9D6D7_9PLEO|nr:hypothetical protein B0J11DRAFT_541912 [Dendryphion nanum]